MENLFLAWKKFQIGKSGKPDVMEFERHLEDNLFALRQELRDGAYQHSGYKHFIISDPKKRNIHKAKVRDRVVHQILYNHLCLKYEPLFTEYTYSSRIGKGTHKAVEQLRILTQEISRLNRGRCFALKCDVKKYFNSIDHAVLLNILRQKVNDQKIMGLIEKVVGGFNGEIGKGIPLGNITSQIFANVYLRELDEFVKNALRLKYYLRYNDDFIILSHNPEILFKSVQKIRDFVAGRLLLELPDEKTVFRKLAWGIDFCGYVVLPNAVLLRQRTKKRMIKNISRTMEKYRKNEIAFKGMVNTANSYLGLLKHCNSHNLKNKILNVLR